MGVSLVSPRVYECEKFRISVLIALEALIVLLEPKVNNSIAIHGPIRHMSGTCPRTQGGQIL